MDGGEEAGAEVVVEVLILTHLKHFLPLLRSHLVLHALRRLVLLTQLLTSKLEQKMVFKPSSNTCICLFPLRKIKRGVP